MRVALAGVLGMAMVAPVAIVVGPTTVGAGEIVLRGGQRIDGELTVDTESLETYRAGPAVPLGWTSGAAGSRVPTHPAAVGASGPAGDLPGLAAYQGTPLPPVPSAAPNQLGLPAVAAYQDLAHPSGTAMGPDPSGTGPTLAVARPDQGKTEGAGGASGGKRVEVVSGESTLYRDAYSTARQVGRVTQGEQLVFLDFLDRRLRILNAVVFDGGQWVKVRATDGTEGWVPAATVREVR